MKSKISIGRVAKMLNKSVHEVRTLADIGLLKSDRTYGKHRRFELSEVERYMAANPIPQYRPVQAQADEPTVDEIKAVFAEVKQILRRAEMPPRSRLDLITWVLERLNSK